MVCGGRSVLHTYVSWGHFLFFFQIVPDRNSGSTFRSRCFHSSHTQCCLFRYHFLRVDLVNVMPAGTLFPYSPPPSQTLSVFCLQHVRSASYCPAWIIHALATAWMPLPVDLARSTIGRRFDRTCYHAPLSLASTTRLAWRSTR